MTASACYTKMVSYVDGMVSAGLDAGYNPMIEQVSGNSKPTTMSDLYEKLLATEARIDSQNNH